jgi:hypothetical protein
VNINPLFPEAPYLAPLKWQSLKFIISQTILNWYVMFILNANSIIVFFFNTGANTRHELLIRFKQSFVFFIEHFYFFNKGPTIINFTCQSKFFKLLSKTLYFVNLKHILATIFGTTNGVPYLVDSEWSILRVSRG